MKIYESGENYLETIYILHKAKATVRAIDVSAALNYSKPSVSRALQILKKAELITIGEDGNIMLSIEGTALAKSTLERHAVIKAFLLSLGLSDDIADTDACRIEHVISSETYNAILSRINK